MMPKNNIPRFRAVDVPVSDFPSILWECDAFHKTAREAADEFAATYWDTPRKALAIDPHGFFRVKGGQRPYQVRLVDNLPPVFRITVGGPE